MSNNTSPQILNKKPEAVLEIKSFHKARLPGWAGFVKIDKIQGWAWNRRIDLFTRKCEGQFGRPPTNDELYNFMLNEEDFHIKELAKSILYNGIKVPIILDMDGTLLDGNRRYIAARYAIEHSPDVKDELVNIPVWVLSGDTTEEDKRKVLVECNFLPDWKVDWPNYIKAMTIYEDYDKGVTYDELAERYGHKKTQIRTWVKVMDLIQEFLNFYDHSDEAIGVAYEHFPFFEEAHNKFRAKLDSDPDFKEQFFAWMKAGKFKSLLQVRPLGEIRDNEEAWAVIRSDSPDAVAAAIHIVQGEKLPSLVDGEKRVKKVIKLLRKLTESEIASIHPETIQELEATLTEVIKMAEAVMNPGLGATDESEGS